ncbi:MAG: DinB family protein [Bacteroidota bacterium]
MNRNRFLRNVLGFGLLSSIGCGMEKDKTVSAAVLAKSRTTDGQKSVKELRKELISAWKRSEIMTMANVQQMPAELFSFKYTAEAMTFSEQWRHCVMYTCGQLAGHAGLRNPYNEIKLPVQMSKEHVIKELEYMYAFVRRSIEDLSDEKLLGNCEFAGSTIPVWRLFYAMENHIIHHRGQCVVYLRLKGVTPKGFYGW